MGFFKNIKLDANAKMLRDSFGAIRSEYYSCIFANVQSATGVPLPPSRRVLAGDADLCLRRLQCVIALIFISEKGYVSNGREMEVFSEALIRHCFGEKNRDNATQYLLKHKSDGIPTLAAEVSLPLARYVLGEDTEPLQVFLAMKATSLTLSALPSTTKCAIASEFGDKKTAHEMALEEGAIASYVESGSSEK